MAEWSIASVLKTEEPQGSVGSNPTSSAKFLVLSYHMPIPTHDYASHYKEFSQNVAFAARTWYHHVYLNTQANENPAILLALNKASRFWMDQRYSAVQTTIIFLGKVFDEDKDAYSVHKMLNAAKNAINYFDKPALRTRKIEAVGEFEGIDDYIKNAHELELQDFKLIQAEVKKAKDIWERAKPLRNKLYAHSQMLSDEERTRLYSSVKNEDITNILQILLNISDALWQAEFNGWKPDFSSNHTKPFEWAKEDIDRLINSLLD